MQLTNQFKKLLALFTAQFLVSMIILLDIPFARQVIGFIYLTFYPGMLILIILNKGRFNLTEWVIFSAGISLSLLIIIGLLVNQIGPLLGLLRPISLMPLMIGINLVISILTVLVCALKLEKSTPHLELRPTIILALIPLFLSVVGMLFEKNFGNNLILMLMLVVVIAIFAFSMISKDPTNEFYSVLVISISLALLFQYTLISRYISGWDIHEEYYINRLTLDQGRWNINPSNNLTMGTISQMMSVTIFPSIFSIVLNLDIIWVIKIVYPIIFSLMPLGLFELTRKHVGSKGAFIAIFFLISQLTFYTEMPGLERQMIAEFFLVVILLLMSNDWLDSFDNKIFFILFSFSMLVSHYAITYIFLFLVSVSWIIFSLILKKTGYKLSLFMIIFLWVMSLSWYIYAAGSYSFSSLLYSLLNITSSLGDFFNVSSRGAAVSMGLGLQGASSVWSQLSRTFAYATEALLVLGFISLAFEDKRLKFNNKQFWSYLPPMTLLAFTILLPNFANALEMTRFYHILLIFLAPLLVLGLKTILRFLPKTRSEVLFCILTLTVLCPFFLFQTGFIYEMVGAESWSIGLSSYRMGPRLTTDFGCISEREVSSANWLLEYWVKNKNISIIYTGINNYLPILDMARNIDSIEFLPLTDTTRVSVGSAIYLGETNVVYGFTLAYAIGTYRWNMTYITKLVLSNSDIVYSNGGSEINLQQ